MTTTNLKKFNWTDANGAVRTLSVNLTNGRVWATNARSDVVGLEWFAAAINQAPQQARSTVFNAAMEAAYAPSKAAALAILKQHLKLTFTVNCF